MDTEIQQQPHHDLCRVSAKAPWHQDLSNTGAQAAWRQKHAHDMLALGVQYQGHNT